MSSRPMHKPILSTADVARLFCVTETTVKRWADEGTLRCQKTPGGHRKFQIRNVVAFAEENNFEPIGALSLPGQPETGEALQVAILKRDFTVLVRTFVDKALSPDRTDLYRFLSYLYGHRIALWEIYDLVLKPGMEVIGDRWSAGLIGIGQEHMASYETLDALAKLQNEILIKAPTGDSAILACLGEELHEIGLRCTASLFEAEGWRTQYLGARTPADAILSAVRDFHPLVIGISVTRVHEKEELAHQLHTIAESARAYGGKMIIGGMGVPADLHGAAWHDGVIHSGRELLTFIEERGNGLRAQGSRGRRVL